MEDKHEKIKRIISEIKNLRGQQGRLLEELERSVAIQDLVGKEFFEDGSVKSVLQGKIDKISDMTLKISTTGRKVNEDKEFALESIPDVIRKFHLDKLEQIADGYALRKIQAQRTRLKW